MSNNLANESSSNLLPLFGATHSSKSNYNYFPLLSGDKFPEFQVSRNSFISLKDSELIPQGITTLQDLLDYPQPLVIAFWTVTGKVDDISQWKSLQADIEIMGGRLLIITNGNYQNFTHSIRKNRELNILEDVHQILAEETGLYDNQNPLSDWLSGVELDIPLPAFYLVGRDKTILFHHIDYALRTLSADDITESAFIRNLLTSVYNASGQRSSLLQRAIS